MPFTSPVIKIVLPPEVSRLVGSAGSRMHFHVLSPSCVVSPPARCDGRSSRGHTQSGPNSRSTTPFQMWEDSSMSSVNVLFFKSNSHSPAEIFSLCWIIPIRYKHLYKANAKSNQINFSTHIPSTPAELALFTVSNSAFIRA